MLIQSGSNVKNDLTNQIWVEQSVTEQQPLIQTHRGSEVGYHTIACPALPSTLTDTPSLNKNTHFTTVKT